MATEAAGEGINLQVCNILFNYDIPWNPNRLEQRMGRIHRYGQEKDCLIFNFVATNTKEGQVLQRLLDKLQEIRDALDRTRSRRRQSRFEKRDHGTGRPTKQLTIAPRTLTEPRPWTACTRRRCSRPVVRQTRCTRW